MSSYLDFIARKTHLENNHGFEPVWIPDILFPFQVHLTEWATRKGIAEKRRDRQRVD